MIICGIDPGKSGALAIYNTETKTSRIDAVIDMPTLDVSKAKGKVKTKISCSELFEATKGYEVDIAYLEFVSASPQMGVSSSFAFGQGFGILEMLCAALQWPLEYVTPAKWKREFSLGPDKEAARAKASQILPANTSLWTPKRGVVTKLQAEGRAEAALIAVWGARQQLKHLKKRVRL
jgi:crossover junction endodeoxyribonuclease RuvC